VAGEIVLDIDVDSHCGGRNGLPGGDISPPGKQFLPPYDFRGVHFSRHSSRKVAVVAKRIPRSRDPAKRMPRCRRIEPVETSGADVGREVLAGKGGAGCHEVRGRALEHDPAAIVAGAGTEVDDPIGMSHDGLVMFDDND
jgi:hypothetical protein